MLLQPFGVVLDLLLPIDVGAAVFLGNLHAALYLILGRLRLQVDLCEGSEVGGVEVNPRVERPHVFVGQLYPVMPALQDTDQFAVAGVVLTRLQDVDVRLWPLPIDVGVEVQVALVEVLVHFSHDTPFVVHHLVFAEVRFRLRPVVARDTVAV